MNETYCLKCKKQIAGLCKECFEKQTTNILVIPEHLKNKPAKLKTCLACGHTYYTFHKCPSSFLANDGIDY